MKTVRDMNVYTNHQNSSAMERRARHKLRKNRNFVIKPADKGSATVILSRENYIREAHRQLNNPKYYKKLDKAIWPENCKMFNAIICCLKDEGHINDKQVKYLAARSKSQTRTFYLLSKIHKPVNTWTDNNIPPGRPIISDWIRVIQYIRIYRLPFKTISKLSKENIPKDSFLVTLDIDSMYTNIGIDAGINSVKRVFDRYPDSDRPDKNIIDLLELSLKGNDISKSSKSPLLYLRYLDDILIIWPHSKEEF